MTIIDIINVNLFIVAENKKKHLCWKYSLNINFKYTFAPENVGHISVKVSTYLMFLYYFFLIFDDNKLKNLN